MAGERKGITYESILYVVLERLRKKGELKGKVFWNETPDGMTIVPDLLVGPDKDHPTAMFLVTHSGSAKESEKKFWRNMGELVEAKTQLATMPRVYNVAFDSVIKESLKKVQASAFDGQLIAGDESYGKALQAWVDANNKSLPKDRFEKADAVKKAISGKGLSALIAKLEADVAKLIRCTNASMKSVWSLERNRPKGYAPAARETFVRRGLSKLLVFEDVDLALRLYGRQRVRVDEVPEYAFSCGLARKSIGRAVPGDREVLNASSILDAQDVRRVIEAAPVGRMAAWLETLRNLPQLEVAANYVLEEYSHLCIPRRLSAQLSALANDPKALVAEVPNGLLWPPRVVWLFEVLLELIKAATGTANGFGYAQLEREACKVAGMPPEGDRFYRIVLPDWVHRRGTEKLPSRAIDGLAFALAHRLKAIDRQRLKRLVDEHPKKAASNIMESKLVTYRGFDPLLELIANAFAGGDTDRIRTSFAEAAELGGQAGKTRIFRSNNTLINWQSASDAGRDHKKKELCGRAVGLRYSWDVKTKTFIKRPGVDKLLLVVDGTWRQSDLDALVRAGWDEIYYPDEMDKLAAAIV